jgi:hypothetical protein
MVTLLLARSRRISPAGHGRLVSRPILRVPIEPHCRSVSRYQRGPDQARARMVVRFSGGLCHGTSLLVSSVSRKSVGRFPERRCSKEHDADTIMSAALASPFSGPKET